MKFLLVDDGERIGKSVGEFFSGYPGCTGWEVCGLRAAIDRAMALWPDVVLFVVPNPEVFSTTVRVIHDLKECMSCRVLIAGPSNAAQLILESQNAGVFQYLDIENIQRDLSKVMLRIQTEPITQKRHGRVIALVSAGGGVGASTMAVNLASVFARKSGECGLLDLHAGDLATLLDMTPQHTIANFCSHAERMDAAMFNSCFLRHKSGIRLLAGVGGIDRFTRLTAAGVRKAIAMSYKSFPYVVIDVGTHVPRDPAEQALRLADIVLIVMRHDLNSLRQAKHVMHTLAEIPVEKRRLRLVVNRFRRGGDLQIRDIVESLGLPLLRSIQDDPRRLSRANSRGVPITLDRPRSQVSRALVDIAHQVNGGPHS
jgi:pilus assembly protein CpaE